jgi:membrane fusion protein (multidrug efflux system)
MIGICLRGVFPAMVVSAFMLTGCGRKQATVPPAPPEVLVTSASAADGPIFIEAIARLNGSTNTDIHAQVSGYLLKQAYQEGSVVKPGDLLFEIDPKPFQAELDQALAAVAGNQAQPQNNLSAQAAVTTAKINLGYTKITSPITGVAGHANPGVGDWISPGMTLTTVSTVDPIQAEFTIPEKLYLDNAALIAKVSNLPLEDRVENIEMVLADGTVYPQKGRFFDVNRQIQASTRAITAYALFPNPDRILRPGQYVKVRGIIQNIRDAVLIPQQCVTQWQGINQVMVVKADNTVEVRNVTTDDVAGSMRIIKSGLKAGEKVIVEGRQKVQDGTLVNPQPWVAPASDQTSTHAPAAAPSKN